MSDDLIQRLRDECHCNDWYLRKAAATALEAKDAEIERLQRDLYLQRSNGYELLAAECEKLQSRAEQAERALAEAVEVLRPFAEIREALELISANKPGDVLLDERAIFQTWGLKDTPTSRQITLGHLRAARQFVKEHTP